MSATNVVGLVSRARASMPDARWPRGGKRPALRSRASAAPGDAVASSSSPPANGGANDPEPFTLGLRRDAEAALELGEPLGRGAMGVVRKVTRISDGEIFALKTIPKVGPISLEGQSPTDQAKAAWERKVRDEVNLHFALSASLDIVTMHDAFEDEAGVHLLIDMCDGGDLLSGASGAHTTEDDDNKVTKPYVSEDEEDASVVPDKGEHWTPFSEATAAPMIRSMLRALAACHEHGVVHRDVKPSNFLFMRDADGARRLKLSDFGLAARISRRGDTLTEHCGTYAYLSPEMARKRPYDFKVDSWAAGVVAYMLLAGEPPFADWDAIREGREPTRAGLLRNIRRGRPGIPVQELPNLSPGAKSLLSSLLQIDPDKRLSCEAAAEHYWVREKGVASHADALAATVVEKLQAYGTLGAVRRACIRAVYETVATQESDGRENTTRLMEAVDKAAEEACKEHEECEAATSGDGSLSMEALKFALRDHGAELAPTEWLSLIRPVAGNGKARGSGKGAFVDNAALAAMLQTPVGGSFSTHVDDAEVGSTTFQDRQSALETDWETIAKASFERILERSKKKPSADLFDMLDETVTFDDVADEVCEWDGSEELCRATLQEEFDRVDTAGTGKLTIAEWTDMVWNEGLMDASGRVKSTCGADAPEYHPEGPQMAGVGAPGCELAPELAPPPTELSPREKARQAAAARKKMMAARQAAKAAARNRQQQ